MANVGEEIGPTRSDQLRVTAAGLGAVAILASIWLGFRFIVDIDRDWVSLFLTLIPLFCLAGLVLGAAVIRRLPPAIGAAVKILAGLAGLIGVFQVVARTYTQVDWLAPLIITALISGGFVKLGVARGWIAFNGPPGRDVDADDRRGAHYAMAFVLMIYLLTLVLTLNHLAAFGAPDVLQAQLVSKEAERTLLGPIYRLRLRTRSRHPETVNASKAFFDGARPAATICLPVRRGVLGLRWLEARDCPPQLTAARSERFEDWYARDWWKLDLKLAALGFFFVLTLSMMWRSF